jgi:signal transduction histidine kinase
VVVRGGDGMSRGQSKEAGANSGPGNRIIATTLLTWLAVEGRVAAHDRAVHALGTTGENLAAAPDWLASGSIGALFSAGEVDPGMARALGHRLVAPEATGLAFYSLGLATPEKAYRRVQSLLPRDELSGAWEVVSIDGQAAEICYAPAHGAEGKASQSRASLCALRRGMLESIPGLYGLLPARVDDASCVAHGAETCRYRITWQSTSRVGLLTGTAIGAGVAVGLVASVAAFSATSFGLASLVSATGLAAGFAVLSGPLVGAVVDLRAQLEAVAGARRGHLALFDQVDDALAAKLDALARADAKLEAEPVPNPVRLASDVSSEDARRAREQDREVQKAAQQIHSASGVLECWFDARANEIGEAEGIERGLVRDIREWAARIGKFGGDSGGAFRGRVDLAKLVARAVATARPSLPPTSVVIIDAKPGLPRIECEPVQIEHVVVQLVQNAIEASIELSDAPEVVISLEETPRGIELAVADRGVGIESTAIDEVFDPFFGDRPAGAGQGLGLTVCLRIVERHGGELRIENQVRAGTRVSVILPTDAIRDAEERIEGASAPGLAEVEEDE